MCDRSEVDDYDVVEPGIVHDMRCDACRGSFSFAVFECYRCGAECSFSWAQKPAPALVCNLACQACGESYAEVDSFSGSSGSVA